MADILVVDDDLSVASAFEHFLADEGHRCRLVSNAADAYAAIEQRRPDLVVMDIRMPGVDGLQALEQLRIRFPGLCVVMMTGYGTSQTSIDAIRAGAFDYITKPPDLDELRALIARALAAARSVDALGTPVEAGEVAHAGLVGETPAMLALYKMIGRLAVNDVPVLVVGERGTGKSLVIATLHANSVRHAEPLTVIDCATATLEQFDEQLFGETSGTIHLDHVDAMPMAVQARLARVLAGDAGRAAPTTRLGARVMASTDHDLSQDVASGLFSRDLLDALALITLRVPPLRERRADLPLLVRHILQRVNSELNRSITGVDDATARQLQDYGWPGNVDELSRVLKRAAIVARSEVITADDVGTLSDAQFQGGTDAASALRRAACAALHERLVDATCRSAFHDVVDFVEKALVREALTITNGNQLKAADLLGLNRATLRKKASQDDV